MGKKECIWANLCEIKLKILYKIRGNAIVVYIVIISIKITVNCVLDEKILH